ncbi:MAG: YfhO family protein [Enterocloster clostridioformis]
MWNIKSDTFYRVEKTDRKTKNDGAWMNFPSVSLFSSTANASLSDFFRKMGCESSTNAYSITGSTPWWTACCPCGTAYMGTSSLPMDSEICPQEKGACGCTRINLPLPVAFMLPSDVEGNWIMDSGNPAHVQNDLCDVLDTEHVLPPNESVTEGRKLTFTAEETGDYYVYVTNKKVKESHGCNRRADESFDNCGPGLLHGAGPHQ